jgi:NAD(P)-dependent dehydrogenase (short-subunit alcohol dehydrogenase family)
MDLELRGKVAAITGGNAGIGLAVAEGLAKEGVDVFLSGRGGDVAAREAERIAAEYGVRTGSVGVDFSTAAGADAFIDAVKSEFGGIDILINNAGLGTAEDIMTAPDEKWQYFWELHVMAAIRVSRGLAPTMMERGGGVILSNGSICATQPMYHEPIYNVTKAALTMFSKCLAHELIPHNIRVNIVQPGLTLTPAWEKYYGKEAAEKGQPLTEFLDEWSRDYAPIGRFGTAQEIADFFVFLASERATYSVGSSYYVDGGWLNTIA